MARGKLFSKFRKVRYYRYSDCVCHYSNECSGELKARNLQNKPEVLCDFHAKEVEWCRKLLKGELI